MKLSDVAIRRPVLASMLSLALVLFGAIAYTQLSVREYPDVDPPVISVTTTLPGASPQVVETAVTDILEEELSTLSGLRTLTSSSSEQSSNITLEFTLDRDVDVAAQDVRDKVSRVRDRLPEDVLEPVIAKQEADAQPFFWMALSGDNYSLLQLSDIADRVVKKRLQSLPGVGSAFIAGERRYAMRLWLSSQALTAHGLTVQDVEAAVASRNVEVPAGRIESAKREFSVRSLGELKTPEEFGELTVSSASGSLVKLKDLGRVELGAEDERSSIRFDGRNALGVGIVRQSKANLLNVADAVTAELPALQKELPPGVRLDVAFDGSSFVRRSIQEAEESLVVAGVLVVIIIFIFLRNLRATIIPGLAIPTSIVATFAIMLAFGFSINNLTLLALTLAIGIVVDDAIIVLENAYRHQEELHEEPVAAAVNGTREIAFAVLATTISLVAVFTPLAFLQGNTGRLFNEFGIAVAGSVIISGFVALTLTPMLCARILRVPPSHGVLYQALERGFDGLASGYARTLDWALRHRLVVLTFTAVAAVGAGWVFTALKHEFVPSEDRGYFLTIGQAPEGSTIAFTDAYQKRLEGIISQTPGVQHYFSAVGGFMGSPARSIVFTMLDDWENRDVTVDQVIGQVQPQFFGVPGVMAFAVNPPAFGGGFGSQVEYVVQNPNFDSLVHGVDTLLKRARQVPGLVNLDSDLRVNKPELTVSFDRDRAEDLGVPVRDVASALQTLLGSRRISTFTQANKQYDVMAQLEPAERATPSDMTGIYLRGRDGQLVQLDALATVKEGVGASQLNHYNRIRSATVTASLAPGFALGEALDSLDRLAGEVMPEGTTTALAGEARELRESGASLYFAFALAIVVVFMVLASQFESLVHPLTVLMAVPLAVMGALFTLLVFKSTINLYSQIGMVLLIGLVTKNSILLVEYSNQLREKGLEVLAAVREAGRIRLRPILMTSVSTIMGAMPIALGLGAGSTSRRPLGYAIVGGILISTILTLYVVPVVYSLMDRFARREAHDLESAALPVEPEPVEAR
ncbi:MAG: efflux RND transporter permease subunit [Gemmatimonadetes bacterium]|nr:efflux RND transporter permease subunit [Gemmatimonadota bacterium]